MHRRTITKRTAGGLAVVALAIAAPAAYAATTSSPKPVVHMYIEKSGLTVVSGYDGGAPLQPKR